MVPYLAAGQLDCAVTDGELQYNGLFRQLDCKKDNLKINKMHPTGFEPVTFHRKTDYESGAFNHSATNAKKLGADGN